MKKISFTGLGKHELYEIYKRLRSNFNRKVNADVKKYAKDVDTIKSYKIPIPKYARKSKGGTFSKASARDMIKAIKGVMEAERRYNEARKRWERKDDMYYRYMLERITEMIRVIQSMPIGNNPTIISDSVNRGENLLSIFHQYGNTLENRKAISEGLQGGGEWEKMQGDAEQYVYGYLLAGQKVTSLTVSQSLTRVLGKLAEWTNNISPLVSHGYTISDGYLYNVNEYTGELERVGYNGDSGIDDIEGDYYL